MCGCHDGLDLVDDKETIEDIVEELTQLSKDEDSPLEWYVTREVM